jgi:signal transduction histidine kinase
MGWIEESQFEQTLVNLVNNAREAMPDGGDLLEVALSLTELDHHSQRLDADGPYPVLEVKDSGRGITAAVQTRVFDPFFYQRTPEQQRFGAFLLLRNRRLMWRLDRH